MTHARFVLMMCICLITSQHDARYDVRHNHDQLKDTIKNAILDGKISNEYDEAYRFMMEKAEKMGLVPKA